MRAAILVDLDDTLLDDRHAMTCAVTEFQRRHGGAGAIAETGLADRWLTITAFHWARFRAGEITFEAQRRERLRDLLQRPLDSSEADALFEQYLTYYQSHWRLAAGADDFLARTANVPKALVSNGEHRQVLGKVSALGIHRHFAVIVTPETAGAGKPNAAIFNHALNALGGVDASASLMVGDSYEADIQPAQALGMATFHVCNRTPGRTIADAANAAWG